MSVKTEQFELNVMDRKAAEAIAVDLYREKHRQLGQVVGRSVRDVRRGWTVTVQQYRMHDR